ncbi:MAG: AAA family ATPase [Clostridiales bacterium]|nr:MAG: AAA family ATPase [Clostridiales bacterium]
MDNLFSASMNYNDRAPLAQRMRPQSIDEIIGQEHILAPGKLLRRSIDTDRLSSIILYGPPGCGKTTIANVIAKVTHKFFQNLNAVTDGVPELRKVVKKAEDDLALYNQQTILFIDEIHRFNKSQQDALLPWVEKGVVILIGATTQNPFFSLNPALLSRSLIFKLEALEISDVVGLLTRALSDKERGLGNYHTDVSEEALEHLANCAQGDVRIALNGLELAVISSAPDENGVRHIDLAAAEESIQRPAVVYDNTGDEHYDIVSAFIKSMRGSDADAAVYYLARMLDAGEDPLFIARRMVILAAEDVGLADPNALVVAQSAANALQFVGLPEGRIILSEAVIYLACAPKSNSAYMAIDTALADLRSGKAAPVPKHLRDSHYKGAAKFGHGKGYKYPHDYEGAWVEQEYLPEKLKGTVYYRPSARDKSRKRGMNDE